MELYEKPFKTFEEQADLLLSRGLVAEKNNLIDALKRIGYYRLTGYLHIFKNEDETYRNDISLEYIYCIYRFDRKLRLLVYDAIERFEVYLRTNLVYELSKTQGPFGYLQKDNFPDITQRNYEIFIDKCKTNFDRSKEEFAEHFKEKYINDNEDEELKLLPPYWMLANVFDFGNLFTLYRASDQQTRRKVANEIGVNARTLRSWLGVLNNVRNICAHHSRLWNRTLGSPAIPNNETWNNVDSQNKKTYPILCVLQYCLKRMAPNSSWKERFFELIDTFPEINLEFMGFPKNWKETTLWKN